MNAQKIGQNLEFETWRHKKLHCLFFRQRLSLIPAASHPCKVLSAGKVMVLDHFSKGGNIIGVYTHVLRGCMTTFDGSWSECSKVEQLPSAVVRYVLGLPVLTGLEWGFSPWYDKSMYLLWLLRLAMILLLSESNGWNNKGMIRLQSALLVGDHVIKIDTKSTKAEFRIWLSVSVIFTFCLQNKYVLCTGL